MKKLVFVAIGLMLITSTMATTPRYNAAAPQKASIDESPTYYLSPGASADDINAKINACKDAGGGTVWLRSGTYTVNKPIVMKSKVRLRGDGQSNTTIRRGWSPTSETGIIYGSGSASDVTISDLTIDGLGYRNYLLHGIYVNGNTWNKLYITKVTVKNCASGIHVKGTNNFILADSNISGNGGSTSGSKGYWHNVYLRRVDKAEVRNCTMSNSPSGCGIQGTDTSNFVVKYCTASNNYWRGIRSAGPNSRYVIFRNNTVQNNGKYGIGNNYENGAPQYFCYIDNTVSGNGDYGINTNSSCAHGQVQGNNCYNNSPGNYLIRGSDIWYP